MYNDGYKIDVCISRLYLGLSYYICMVMWEEGGGGRYDTTPPPNSSHYIKQTHFFKM